MTDKLPNSVHLVGKLPRDPEKFTFAAKDGEGVGARFTLSFGGKTAAYVNVSAFGELAQTVLENARKDDRVEVKGRLNYREWQDETCKKRNAVSIVAEEVHSWDADEQPATRPAQVKLPLKTELDRELPLQEFSQDGPESDKIPF